MVIKIYATKKTKRIPGLLKSETFVLARQKAFEVSRNLQALRNINSIFPRFPFVEAQFVFIEKCGISNSLCADGSFD